MNFSYQQELIKKYILSEPLSYIRESARDTNRWLKGNNPWLYHLISLRFLKLYVRHLRTQFFLISFPKCGRTWLRVMICRALAKKFDIEWDDYKKLRQMSRQHKGIPNLSVVHEDDPFWKTPDQLTVSKEAFRPHGVVFLVREPKDVLVSSYFHKAEKMNVFEGTLSDFIKIEEGGYDTLLHYYKNWFNNRNIPRKFILIRYEDLHEQPLSELNSIFQVFGLSVPDSILEEAVDFASFERMRMRERKQFGPEDGTNSESLKTRRGIVGGYKDYLTEEQVFELNNKIYETLPEEFDYPV